MHKRKSINECMPLLTDFAMLTFSNFRKFLLFYHAIEQTLFNSSLFNYFKIAIDLDNMYISFVLMCSCKRRSSDLQYVTLFVCVLK